VKGSCNEAKCNLTCVANGFQGGRCVEGPRGRYCKCITFWKDVVDARVGTEQGGDDGGKI
jgi:hypothetical protein